ILVTENRVTLAKEWSPAEVEKHGRFSAHTNSVIVTVGKVLAVGRDVTPMIGAAWTDMLAIITTADAG
ncbi:hypothetical protein JF66_14040, partial [Cryobacterium sp. MLB-32]|uniref:hypothetical protein n=1 Tax=Cryobacterium sp. MLB-32 TaxID=1529318 RepID=UPI0004E643A5